MALADRIILSVVVHLFCDWFLQNHWMAVHKGSLRHLAAWIHSCIHIIGLLLIFPPMYAIGIGITHLIIDTRKPLEMWRNFFRQTREGDYALHVSIWQDQVAHIVILTLASLLMKVAS